MQPSSRSQDRKTALITGASSGIGLELSYVFAQAGYDLVIIARNEQRLDEVANRLATEYHIDVRTLPKDLSEPSSSQEIYDDIKKMPVEITALVNNAGFGIYGYFSETNLQEELRLLQVNMVALTHLTKLFLREMLARGRGEILNVASTAGFQPGPLMSVYYASKAYVISFTEALANELKGTGVTASVLCPAPTITELHQRAEMEDVRLVDKRLMMSAKRVARIGYRGLRKGKVVIVPGMLNKIAAILVRWGPRPLVRNVVRKIQEK